MANKQVQRIRLRCEGSPVKFDGTVTSSSPDGKHIMVLFDGTSELRSLHAYGDHKMTSDMKDPHGNATEDVRMMASGLWWEVL